MENGVVKVKKVARFVIRGHSNNGDRVKQMFRVYGAGSESAETVLCTKLVLSQNYDLYVGKGKFEVLHNRNGWYLFRSAYGMKVSTALHIADVLRSLQVKGALMPDTIADKVLAVRRERRVAAATLWQVGAGVYITPELVAKATVVPGGECFPEQPVKVGVGAKVEGLTDLEKATIHLGAVYGNVLKAFEDIMLSSRLAVDVTGAMVGSEWVHNVTFLKLLGKWLTRDGFAAILYTAHLGAKVVELRLKVGINEWE